jgi:hypothetical protein
MLPYDNEYESFVPHFSFVSEKKITSSLKFLTLLGPLLDILDYFLFFSSVIKGLYDYAV